MTRKFLYERVEKRAGKIQIFLFLFFIVFSIGLCQNNNSAADDEKKLREEILAVYQSKGEQAVRDFFKKKKEKITNQFIYRFAKAGLRKENMSWLKICEIIAEEKRDKWILADVYIKMSNILFPPDYKNAKLYLEKALKICVELKDLQGQGRVYIGKGIIASLIESNKKAIEMFNKAETLLAEADAPISQGNVCLAKATIYIKTGEKEKALETYDRAIQLFEKKSYSIGIGNAYYGKGDIYLMLSEYSKALKMYEKALPYYVKIDFISGQGNVFKSKGEVYFSKGDYVNSEKWNDKAMILYKKAGALLGQGSVLQQKGDIYFTKGDFDKAEKMYKETLPFYEQFGAHEVMGDLYLSLGDISYQRGNLSNAEELYNKAIKSFENVGSISYMALAFIKKGLIYFYRTDYKNALKMYNKALELFEKDDDLAGQGNVFKNKGDLYFYRGNYLNAEKMYNQALDFHIKTESPINLGDIFNRKGDIYINRGEYSKAENVCNKALEYFKKVDEPSGQGKVFLNKGDIFFYKKDQKNALKMYARALAFYERGEELPGQAEVYYRKGMVYFSEGDHSRAIEMYDTAIKLCKKTGNFESEAYVLYEKANILMKQGKKDETHKLLEEAIDKLEKVRMLTAIPDMKRTFLKKVYEQYENAALFMLGAGYFDKGYRYAESMKSRIFLDQMGEGLIMLEKGLNPGLKEKRDHLITKLSNISKDMHKTWLKDEKKKKELSDLFQETKSEFEELLIKIRLENPLYAQVKYPQPVELEHLQQKALKKDEIIIEYFVSNKDIYILLVTTEIFKPVKLKEGKAAIDKAVQNYLDSISSLPPGKKDRTIMKKNLSAGTTLYSLIFKPIENDIKGRKIIIVPDGEIAKIPFEALIIENDNKTKKPVYLLEKYSIQYIQSASVLSFLREHYQGKRKTNSFIGFGDPVYDYENFKQGKPEQGTIIRSTNETDEIKEVHRTRYARDGGKLNRLPQSGEEIKEIARLFKNASQQQVVRLRTQATEDNVKASGIKDFDFIHIACHGLLNDDFQSLVLSRDLPGAKEDGYLTLNEIMNCDFHAKLAVLSACQTGTGKIERGEGVIGLTRAVMYAGTPAVVASLWEVESKATKKLMINFYRNMLENKMDKTEALRQAKLGLLKSKKYSSPYFWSAFVMYGE